VKIAVIAIGKARRDEAAALFDHYAKRIRSTLDLRELPEAKGRTADERMVCRVASEITGTVEGGGSVIRWSVDLIAADPLLYENAEVTAQRTGTGSWTATNTGLVPVPPTLEIVGPTNTGTFSLRNDTDGVKGVELTGVQSLAAGAIATVDLANRTVFHHLTYHPENVIAATTDWWRLRPGANTLAASGSGMQAGTVVRARWRPARI